jgi:diacylglycerol kinase (ATP)
MGTRGTSGLRFFFVVNPTAGRGKALHTWWNLHAILQRLAIDFSYAFTEYPGHATILTQQAVTAGFETCVGVGGDGTLSEMVPALIGTQTALACVPAGTGNDFARGLGWPRLPALIVPLLTTAIRQRIDVPRVNDKPYLNVASAGFDAAVADTVNRQFQALHGTLPYLLGLFKTLLTYRNAPLVIRFDDGAPTERRVLFIAAGNLSFYGGGMKVCPHASPHDGLLDFCVAGDITKGEALVTLPKLFKGTHLSHPKCTYQRAQSASVDGPPLPIQADGQIIGTLPATFAVEPSALWALLPAQHPI